MMGNNNHLEPCKILNERVQNEIDEMYDVHRIHFLSVTALIPVCGFAGVWICIIWWSAANAQEKWKL